jgi:HAD superfamily hydrolase (TIGR01490 family)
VQLALFDLDGTLLDGDHDVQWALHLAAKGIVEEAPIHRFLAEYSRGHLDVEAFCAYQVAPLAAHPPERLRAWRAEFFEQRIRPRLRPWARDALEGHRARGHTVALVTASSRFLTEPTAAALGVGELIATEFEQRDGRFTGRLRPPPCFREGKLVHLERWLAARGARWSDVEASWAYSDSHNDLPLLARAQRAVAVTPDERLAGEARARGWTVLDAAGRELGDGGAPATTPTRPG